MKSITSLSLFLFIYTALTAQITNHPSFSEPFIEVAGTAEMEVTPDEIYISITLEERVTGKDKITVEEQEKQLKSELQRIKVSTENFYLSDASANYVQINWAKKDAISRKEYLLKVDSAETVTRVFELLNKLKIDGADIARVSHSMIEGFRKEVRIMAITAAKEKADYLLDALDQKTGKALMVKETSRNIGEERFANVRREKQQAIYYSLNQDEQKPSTTEFRKIQLRASMFVMFSIE